MKKKKPNEEALIRDGKIYAILSYLSILCIIPLVLKKDNPFCLQHGRQGLVIFIAEVAVFIIHIILGEWFLRLGIFVFGVISFIGMIYVVKGQYVKIPIVTDVAEQITL